MCVAHYEDWSSDKEFRNSVTPPTHSFKAAPFNVQRNLLAGSFNFTVSSNRFYYFFKTEVSASMSRPRYTINLGFTTEVQMMMGLKGSWVLANFLVIRLTEFTGPPCTINTHTFVHTGTQGEKTPKFV